MARAFHPKVLTANHLRSGAVVWRTADGRWSADPRAAELLSDAADAEVLLLAAQGQTQEVIGPYLAEARPGLHGPELVHIREQLRATGPSAGPTAGAVPEGASDTVAGGRRAAQLETL